MSIIKALFKRKKDDDFETVLSKLADDIKNRQIKLSELRLRERRATLLATMYTLAVWGAYISLWYMRMLPRLHDGRQRGVERAIKAIPVLIGPIIILFIRRIVQIWYQRKGDAEDKTLRGLMKERNKVLEEVKEKTKFYSTQELLSRYDVTPDSSPAHPRVSPIPSTPRRTPAISGNVGAPVQPDSQSNPSVASPPFPVTPRKQWYDKLADSLLGDDENVAGASTSRYALICESCFAHNGLVKESMWADTQYVCPKCNHFNPAPRSKKSSPGVSPQSVGRSFTSEPGPRSSPTTRQVKTRTGASPTRSGGDSTRMEVDHIDP
ncbi:putative integral membrane metal-binding protein (DUF2296) domain containing protein [Amanita muscaria]